MLMACSCVIDGRTGQLKVQPVDHRKFTVFAETILAANRAAAVELGQLPNTPQGLSQLHTAKAIGLDGNGGTDYGAIARRKAERDERERLEAEAE
jgi:hypothetical protein